MKTNFYEFSQNNSGGSFTTNDKLCGRLFIEAESEEKACEIAEEIGVYFNGVSDGIDCPCCGDRWYSPDKLTFPIKWDSKISFNSVEEYANFLTKEYNRTLPDSRIFYLSGKILEVFSEK